MDSSARTFRPATARAGAGVRRLKVLLASSNPANPDDLFGSAFELSQARLLSRHYDVSLLAVAPAPPLGVQLRQLAVRAMRGRSVDLARDASSAMQNALGRFCALRHDLDGVSVLERRIPLLFDYSQGDLAAWVAAALGAYRTYCRAVGPPDLIHAHGRFLYAGVFALAVQRSAGVPYIYTEHSSFYARGLAPAEARSVLSEVVSGAAAFAPVSAAVAKSVGIYLGRSTPAIVIGNALDPLFEAMPSAAPPAGRFVFLNASSLEPVKGIDVLLRAFAMAFRRDPGIALVICGDGSARLELQKLARELGIDTTVSFRGWVAPQEMPALVDGAHAVVVSSHVETFSVITVEALARGRPVIATRCGGPEDLLTKANGRLVPPDDAAALATALGSVVRDYQSFDLQKIRADALARHGGDAYLRCIDGIYRAAIASEMSHW